MGGEEGRDKERKRKEKREKRGMRKERGKDFFFWIEKKRGIQVVKEKKKKNQTQ